MRVPAATALLALWAGAAPACEICLAAAGERISLADRLAHADRVALAVPDAGGGLRITTTIAGDAPEGAVIVDAGDEPFVAQGGPLLIIADGSAPVWTSLGEIDAAASGWLAFLAGAPDDWRKRVIAALPHLGGGRHTLAEEIAWGEIAAAPYARLAAVSGRLDPAVVAGWLEDPDLAPHRAGVLHLYGLTAGDAGAATIRARAVAAADAHDATLLGPLLTSDLELGGPARVDWIEARYFADRSRSMAEIDAALTGLRLQGEADAAVPRERIVAAFRRFVAERPGMAASVAGPLADWSAWDACADFEALLAAGVADPASEFAMTRYLQRADAAQPDGG